MNRMKSRSVAPSGIVHEVLTEDNYERWRAVMQNYLQGQGLWEVVHDQENAEVQTAKNHVFQREILETVKKPWSHFSPPYDTDHPNLTPDIEQGLWAEVETGASRKMKDAKALHIIQLSCEPRISDEISHFKTAKSAWNHLSRQYGNDLLKASPDTEQVVFGNRLDGKHRRLVRMLEKGDYIGNDIMDPDIDIFVTLASSRTLLHVAVIAGKGDNVEKLVEKGGERLLYKQDKHGYTALALAARYTRNVDVVKCMVESNDDKSLLTMQNIDKEVEIPVLLAAANGHKEMTTYLYNETPQEVLNNSTTQILLLSLCITAEIFDVALRLLMRYPELSKESLLLSSKLSIPKSLRDSLSLPNKLFDSDEGSKPDKFSILEALAKMPSAFPSGNRFRPKEQLIYDMWSVDDKKIRDNYGITSIANFVSTVTRVVPVDNTRQKTSPAPWSGSWFFSKQVLIFLEKCLGLLPYGILYFSVLIWSFPIVVTVSGVRKIYDQKYAHYQVLGILYYFSQSIAEFNHIQLRKAFAYEAMLHAAQNGIVEFINAMKEANHNLLFAVDSFNRGIFSYAIINRRENVFQLLQCFNGPKEIFSCQIDTFGNNWLHLASYLGPSSNSDGRSVPALQMHREIKWLKVVEKLVHPMYKQSKNKDGKKPYELFKETHEEQVKLGEKWTKEATTSFIVVGTLVTTIMFAAAFTVPGGNNQETGLPIFLNDKSFTTFLVADALSLFTSITSILIFIMIHTSRFAEIDFLHLLDKLLIGIWFLCGSVYLMIIASLASFGLISKGSQFYRRHLLLPLAICGELPIIFLLTWQVSIAYEIYLLRDPMASFKK